MKNTNIILVVLFVCISIFSCKKDKIDIYEQDASVYFNGAQPVYSFFENPDKVEVGFDTVYAPIKISGSAVDYDRYVNVEVVDTAKRHTALPKMYALERGVVKANEYVGSVPVRINYTKELDDSSRVLVLRISSNEDFRLNDFSQLSHISFGNVAMRPENWTMLSRVFGNYSNSWYAFILKTLDMNSIPCKYSAGEFQSGITKEEAERWPMTYAEMAALGYVVKLALIEYNNTHDEPMQHEDGQYKDTDVSMKI